MSVVFLDTEFTGLHQSTTLISLALYIDEQNYFYAELNDYDPSQVFEWLEEHVLPKLIFKQEHAAYIEISDTQIQMKSRTEEVREQLKEWLAHYEIIEIWADVMAYDWVLFCQLFGGAFNIPDNVFYAPFDLATLFRIKGLIEPLGKYERDVKRFEFAGIDDEKQHHALEDARVEKICWDKLMIL